MKKIFKKAFAVSLMLALALQTTACGSKDAGTKNEVGGNAAENGLKPGDEGFAFDYTMPEDWEPVKYPSDNATKIVSILTEASAGKGFIPAGDYFKGAEMLCLYAEVPEESFWNRSEGIPSELYDLPVNINVIQNGMRLVSAVEFAELNADQITYYVQAAMRAMMIYDNIPAFDDASLDKFYNDALYYEYPGDNFENTNAYHAISLYAMDGMQSTEAAFLTDDSLCYLASDGSIRVRGMILYHTEYTKYGVEYGKCFTEIAIGVIPDSIKEQPCEWQFGDLYFMGYLDIVQPELITQEEYEALLEQYDFIQGIPDMPEWAEVYGGTE